MLQNESTLRIEPKKFHSQFLPFHVSTVSDWGMRFRALVTQQCVIGLWKCNSGHGPRPSQNFKGKKINRDGMW
jgi:hypothetical protein